MHYQHPHSIAPTSSSPSIGMQGSGANNGASGGYPQTNQLNNMYQNNQYQSNHPAHLQQQQQQQHLNMHYPPQNSNQNATPVIKLEPQQHQQQMPNRSNFLQQESPLQIPQMSAYKSNTPYQMEYSSSAVNSPQIKLEDTSSSSHSACPTPGLGNANKLFQKINQCIFIRHC